MNDKEPKVNSVRAAVINALKHQQGERLRLAKQRARALAPQAPLIPKVPK